jgi:hypothetical protein
MRLYTYILAQLVEPDLPRVAISELLRDQYKNLCYSEPVKGEVKLRARSEVGLACSDGSVRVTRLADLEQARQVGTKFICARLPIAESSITTSG